MLRGFSAPAHLSSFVRRRRKEMLQFVKFVPSERHRNIFIELTVCDLLCASHSRTVPSLLICDSGVVCRLFSPANYSVAVLVCVQSVTFRFFFWAWLSSSHSLSLMLHFFLPRNRQDSEWNQPGTAPVFKQLLYSNRNIRRLRSLYEGRAAESAKLFSSHCLVLRVAYAVGIAMSEICALEMACELVVICYLA